MNLPATDPAANATQDVLCAIWGRVLGREPVGPDDDLFALGGGWFDAARASRLARDAFDVTLAPAELAAAATPSGLATFLERRRSAAGTVTSGAATAPPAVSQLGMLWHEQLVPGAFNLAPFVRRLRGPLDRGALAAAFEQLVARHEPLRTTFEVRHGEPVQVVGDQPALRLPVTDLGDRAAATAETEAAAVIADAGSRPFDLAAGPLFDPSLIRLGPDDHLLVVRLHHTVFDDWSLGVYRRELAALHAGVRDGDPALLPELPTTFSDFARRQRRRLAAHAGAEQLAWWRGQLQGAPLTTQLALGDPSNGRAGPSEPVNLALPPELAARLRALARHGRVTPFMLLLAAFQLLLHRRTGQDDLLIASVVTGRGERAVEGLIGCFTKKVPLRLRLQGDPTFLELLVEVRDVLLSALSHQELGFEEVLQEALGRQAARHGVVPHLPIMFQGLVPARSSLDLAGLTGSAFGSSERQGPGMHVVSEEAAERSAAPVWGDGLYPGTFLGISVVDDGQELAVRAQGGFHRPTVQALLDEFRDLLTDVVARPLAAVTDLIACRGESADHFLGFRLNRPRLEHTVADCCGARKAALVEHDGEVAEARLAARVEADPGAVPDLRELRVRQWRALPGSMWPTELIVADGSTEASVPFGVSTEQESLLASAWAAQLGLPDLDTESNYWQSFSFLDAVADVRQRGLVITPEQLARHRTLQTLAIDLAASGTAADTAGTAESTPAEVIRAERLCKTYPGGLRAVDELDLSVHEGEVFGLLGPNGAGKTTTVGMLTTLVLPTGGRACVGGVDVVADPAMAKQYLGVVPQANDLDNSLTVFENLYFHGRYFGMGARTARSTAYRMLERFRLTGRGRDKVEQLSGGMLRRLQLARALMHGPAVAFLDEPTAGLDPQSRLALWDIVAELKAEGQTVLLTTHYMEEAERFCDRVAIMDHGRILALDTPDGLKRSYGAAGIVLLRGTGDLDRLVVELAALDRVHEAVAADGGVRIRLDGSDGALSSVTALAERSGVKVTDVAVSDDSLEAVFISLTGRELRE